MSHRLQVLIPESLDVRIRQAAERDRVSKGEWVRRAIERALKEKRPSKSALAGLLSLDAPTGDIEEMLEEIEKGRER
jgi:hypothetical protein